MTDIPENTHITYQAQYRKCGKSCRTCVRRAGHGPYLYAYWREEGHTRSKSTGRTLKVETVQTYFYQVYRVVEGKQTQWDAFKHRVLEGEVEDANLTQEQLQLLVVACKEHIGLRKRKKTLVDAHNRSREQHLDTVAV